MPDDAGLAEAEVSGAMSESENDYDENDTHGRNEDDRMAEQNGPSEGVDSNGDAKKKYDPKDPLRPRRKKARRACFACQRAHLTCGKFSTYTSPRELLNHGPIHTSASIKWAIRERNC